MKIKESKITKLFITEIESLDPVSVTFEDFNKNQGQITITCYGKAWTAYWGSMGTTLIDFFLSCDKYYIAKNLSSINSTEIDYELISKEISEDVEFQTSVLYQEKLEDAYGYEWYMNLPVKPNSEYSYLCRIIEAVQTAMATIPTKTQIEPC